MGTTTEPPYAGLLVNGRSGTSAAPLVATRGERLRLRIVNASAATTHRVGMSGHRLTVTHADGQRVQPVEVDTLVLGMGERYDVVVRMDNPGISFLFAGSINATTPGVIVPVLYATGATPAPAVPLWPPSLLAGRALTYADLRPFVARDVTAPGRSLTLTLGTSPTGAWTINGQAFPDADVIPVRLGERVRLQFANMSMVRHPMHLHGHFFQLVDLPRQDVRPAPSRTRCWSRR